MHRFLVMRLGKAARAGSKSSSIRSPTTPNCGSIMDIRLVENGRETVLYTR